MLIDQKKRTANIVKMKLFQLVDFPQLTLVLVRKVGAKFAKGAKWLLYLAAALNEISLFGDFDQRT